MTKAGNRTLQYNNTSQFWPFNKMFLTHIDNMGWEDAFKIPVNGVNKNLATNFGEVEIADIETERNTQNNGTV